MGLIKAATSAIGSTFGDQWKEVIRCEDLTNNILMMKKTTENGVISNGSTIIVAPGQCAVIYDNGRVIDATAEDGTYTFDTSSTPSFFAGQFGAVFKEMWQRFQYDGGTAKQQAVYFFNLKEILDNKFGTPSPVPYKDWGHPLMNARTNSYLPMSVEVKCFGKYTFKIEDVSLFMQNIGGTATIYRKEDLAEQIRAEVIGSFSNVMNSLGSDKHKIDVLDLPNQTDEIKEIMDEEVFDKPIRDRGIKLVSFVIESLTLTEDSKDKIDKYEIGGDAYQQQGVVTEGYVDAMKGAANNANGAANGFMGLGMMNMQTGSMGISMNNAKPMTPDPSKLNNTPVADEADEMVVNKQEVEVKEESKPEEKEATDRCANCNEVVAGRFCSNCGTEKKVEKRCKNCNTLLKEGSKFCSECGTKA